MSRSDNIIPQYLGWTFLCTSFRGTVEKPRSNECTWTRGWSDAPGHGKAQLDCPLPGDDDAVVEVPVRIITTGHHIVDGFFSFSDEVAGMHQVRVYSRLPELLLLLDDLPRILHQKIVTESRRLPGLIAESPQPDIFF